LSKIWKGDWLKIGQVESATVRDRQPSRALLRRELWQSSKAREG
jgi:hypothetical protein